MQSLKSHSYKEIQESTSLVGTRVSPREKNINDIPYFSIILLNGTQWNFPYSTISHLRAKIASRLSTISTAITLMLGDQIITDTYRGDAHDYPLLPNNLKSEPNHMILHCINNENIDDLLTQLHIIKTDIIYHMEIDDIHIIQWLKDHFENSVVTDIIKNTWLHAARNGRLHAIEFLLTHIVKSNRNHDTGDANHKEPSDSFFDMNINDRDHQFGGDTALSLSCLHGHLPVVNCLIDHAADISSHYKISPLAIATRAGHLFIINRLLSVTSYQQEDMNIALKIACEEGFIDIVHYLIDKKVDINYHSDRWSACMIAAENGFTDIMSLLIQAQGNINFQSDAGGNTALMLASKRHYPIVRILIMAGANINIQNQRGVTALMISVLFNQEDIINYLLDADAELYLEDLEGQTALDLAIQENHSTIINRLRDVGTLRCQTLDSS